jgi:hypothetical protein
MVWGEFDSGCDSDVGWDKIKCKGRCFFFCLDLPLNTDMFRAFRFFSIVGIVGTVIPVMNKLFGEIIVKVAVALGRMMYSCFRPILMWLAKDLPKFCHEYGVFEAALYLA